MFSKRKLSDGPLTVTTQELPRVLVSCDQVGDDQLRLAVRVSERANSAKLRSARILLDGALVARTRSADAVLVFTRPLVQLSSGKHQVQFLVFYDSGDHQSWNRVFAYDGPTERDARAGAHVLTDHGAGSVSMRRSVLWRVDDSRELPVTVVLRTAPGVSMFLQACRTGPGDFQAPVMVEDGAARLVLADERYFVVGASGAGERYYDLQLEDRPAEASSALALWQPRDSRPAAYGLCVGISKYRYINSLEFCDEDATDWTRYLGQQYETRLLGDGVSSYAPFVPVALATEVNIRQYMRGLRDVVRAGDLVTFVDSGHGSGDGKGYSWLCCLDERGVADGEYDDKELAEDVGALTDLGARVLIIIDACYSGGLIDNLQARCGEAADAPWFIATTCTMSGFGFDDAATHHGAWTNAFLIRGLMSRFAGKNPRLGDVFEYALGIYTYKSERKNMPQCAGNQNLCLFP